MPKCRSSSHCSAGWRRTSAGRSGRSVTSSRRPASSRGALIADTTGGTSLGCVLAHVARTRPKAAIVVTDGYIEPIARAQVKATAGTRLHVVLTRDGSATQLRRAGLSYTQLSKVPS